MIYAHKILDEAYFIIQASQIVGTKIKSHKEISEIWKEVNLPLYDLFVAETLLNYQISFASFVLQFHPPEPDF